MKGENIGSHVAVPSLKAKFDQQRESVARAFSQQMTYQLGGCMDSMAHGRRGGPDLGVRDMGYQAAA